MAFLIFPHSFIIWRHLTDLEDLCMALFGALSGSLGLEQQSFLPIHFVDAPTKRTNRT